MLTERGNGMAGAAVVLYLASRVLGEGGAMFGTLPVGIDTAVLAGAAVPTPQA